MFTLGKVLISTRGLAPGNYHFYMNAKPSVAMVQGEMCQCPLGLIPHFYPGVTNIESPLALMCQCPLGLIPHFYSNKMVDITNCGNGDVSMPSRAYTSFLRSYNNCNRYGRKLCVNALSGLYLISTVPLQKPRFYAVFRACFCRYLSEYSDNSRFSCMLTFWTYLIRCTYP